MTLYTSLLTAGTNSHAESSENANALGTDFFSAGVIGSTTNTAGVGPMTGAFGVSAQGSPNMTVAVNSGVAWVTATPSSQDSQLLRVRNTASTNVTISANSSGSTKYDWLYIQIDATKAANPGVNGDDVATLVTSRSSSSTTDNGTPPTYGLVLAVITVSNGASSITNSNITDKRVAAVQSASNSATTTGWNALGYSLTYGANNGNKEFTVTTANDLTGILTPGMRFKVTRSTTPPTQSMSFVSASSQYATKASPSGITFTNNFTVEAWIYLNSYGNTTILSRFDGSNGFQLAINPSGQILLVGFNASSSNYSQTLSYQSVPLKRWVHIAAELDMATFTAAASPIYLNGASIPVVVSRGGTNPTALVQGGNLQVAALNATNFFDGYISEARVWSTKQTQANIQSNMAISLTGSETNLVAIFQGNGNFNDSTTNANHLTATNGATFVTANPYNATEYAIVTKVSYSNPTTTVTLFAGTDYTIPNQTLNNPYYSTARAPYGGNWQRTRWIVEVLDRTVETQASPTTSTWYNVGSTQIAVPTGEWNVEYQVITDITHAGAANLAQYMTLSTANNSQSDADLTAFGVAVSASLTEAFGLVSRRKQISTSSQTTYYLNAQTQTATTTNIKTRGDLGTTVVRAECLHI